MRDVDKSTAAYLKARGPYTWTVQDKAVMSDGSPVVYQCDVCGGRYPVVAYGLTDEGDIGARVCIANAGCLDAVTDPSFASHVRFEKVAGVRWTAPSLDDVPGLDFTVENPEEPYPGVYYDEFIKPAILFKKCGFGRKWHKIIEALLKAYETGADLTNLQVETLRRYCDVCRKEKEAR